MSKENRVSDELLPCPFCGGTAKLRNYRVAEDAMGCHVACTKCLVQTDVFEDAYTPFEQAIRAWNTRSKPVAGVEVKAYLHLPTGNVFKPDDYVPLVAMWKKQFADTHSPEEIEADFASLYASPQPDAVIREEMVERAISEAAAWNEVEGDPADTLHHGRSVIQKIRIALTAALKEA